jgi:PD-(D/E)XK nuclease superfamily
LFLVRTVQATYRWHPQKPYLVLRFIVLEPKVSAPQAFSGRLYCTARALWKLNWFLRDFCYDMELLARDQIDEKALLSLRGVIRTSHTAVNGRSYQNLDAFAAETEWDGRSCESVCGNDASGRADDQMTYSYTQLSQYLRCPRSYRYRYLDGWREKETRAAMVFGRCFENALGALFRKEDPGAALFTEWVLTDYQPAYSAELRSSQKMRASE